MNEKKDSMADFHCKHCGEEKKLSETAAISAEIRCNDCWKTLAMKIVNYYWNWE